MQMRFNNISYQTDYESESVFNFPIQLAEDKNYIVLRALAPGMQEKDIEILLTGQKLSLAGSIACRTGRYLRQECPCGVFKREIDLGCQVNSDSVRAKLDAGVLTITIQKYKNSKQQKIPVHYGG